MLQKSMAQRRPRSELKSVVLYNKTDDEGKWVWIPISVGSWVTMKPSAIGSHGIKKRRLHDINIHWKGLVKGFKMSNGGKKVAKIQVAHVYDYREMSKEKVFIQPDFPRIDCNCEYG